MLYSIEEYLEIFESIKESIPTRVQDLISDLSKDSIIYAFQDTEKIVLNKSNTILNGIKLIYDDKIFRINWSKNTIDSIDLWDWDSPSNIDQPDLTAHIVSTADTGSLSNDIINLLSIDKFEVVKNLITESIKLFAIKPSEKSTVIDNSEDPEKESTDIIADMRDLVGMVARGINPSLIIAGRGGTGKSHNVKSVLEDEYSMEEDEDFFIIKGQTTGFGLYKSLYSHRDSLVVFDDCDSVFGDKNAVNLLKAALDSNERRNLSWVSNSTYDPRNEESVKSNHIPNTFDFTGSIIFITNKKIKDLDEALRTRSYVIEVEISEKELLNIIDQKLHDILPDVDLSIKQEVLEFLKKNASSLNSPLNMRTLIKAIKLRLTDSPNWKILIKKYI